MSRKHHRWSGLFGAFLLLAALPVWARVKVSPLAEKLLYGGAISRDEAVKEFNNLPAEAQERLVPDFMVALSDEDPQVRKIASRILKSMGVKTGEGVPDANKELSATPSKPTGQDKWTEEKKMREPPVPEAKKELPVPEKKPSGADKWSDLTKMRGEESGQYADLKQQLAMEKRGQVTLDAAQLRADAEGSSSVLSAVTDSLKDPDPWVRAQAARRVGMIKPAPLEAIPTLIKMLGDKEPESRRAAVAALGSFGHLAQEAIIPLNAAMSDPDPAVRTLASDALKQIQQR